MSYADKVFKENLRSIIEEGTSTEGQKVRPHWEDGTPNPTGKGIRSKAKGLVLGIMYGMGAKLMSTILNVTIEECNDILKEFFEMLIIIHIDNDIKKR